MSQSKIGNHGRLSAFTLTIVFAALVASAALSVMPDLAKPLFMKYYRSVYQVEVVRGS